MQGIKRIEDGRDSDGVLHIVGVSGGKDSTALALRLKELGEREYTYMITPTGDELPEMVVHWELLENLLGKKFARVTSGYDLNSLIDAYQALPNFRQRWCTRVLKIEPALAFYAVNAPCVAYIGLRADEEERPGIYGSEIPQVHPFKQWGWGIDDVRGYLCKKGVTIPRRTDCARCYHQRLGEWQRLHRDYPEVYAHAEAQEERIGKTFRSPGRDSRPSKLSELKMLFPLPTVKDDEEGSVCRVCSL